MVSVIISGKAWSVLMASVLDFVLSVVGQLDPSSIHSKTQIQRPNIRIRDSTTKQIVENATSDVPDLLSVNAAITPSPLSVPNATLSFLFRRGQPFPGMPALTWTINCEYGEMRVTSATSSSFRSSESDGPVVIQIHHFDTNEVEDIHWDWSDLQKEIPIAGRDVMECLFAFADGRKEGDGWVGLEDAARHAQVIQTFLEV